MEHSEKTISIQRAVASVKNHVPNSKSPTLQHPGSKNWVYHPYTS